MSEDQSRETDQFTLKLIELQYSTIRTEIEFYLARMFDVLKLTLATIPILAGALIALVADQATWELATQQPILLGLFCLLSPVFLVIATYLGSLGIAQYRAVTRAADYIKVHFEDYLFHPILNEMDRRKANHVFESAKLKEFMFWENYLSQHGYDKADTRFRNNYDHDKYVMQAFLILLCISILVVSSISGAAFKVLIAQSAFISGIRNLPGDLEVFDGLIVMSALLFSLSLIWAISSFWKFFQTLRMTGALKATLEGGLKNN